MENYKKFSKKPPDQWPVSGYGNMTYAERSKKRVLQEHSQMMGYKRAFLSKNSVFPVVEKEVNRLL